MIAILILSFFILGFFFAHGLEVVNQGFDFLGGTAMRLFVAIALVWICFMVTGCSTPVLVVPSIATVQAEPWQKGDLGLYFNLENKDYLVSEGIPESFFTWTPRGFYMDRLNLIQAENIRDAKRNGTLWTP